MDATHHFNLRLACLELAKQVCLHEESTNKIEERAESYWRWIVQEDPAPFKYGPPTEKGVAKVDALDDDIPF